MSSAITVGTRAGLLHRLRRERPVAELAPPPRIEPTNESDRPLFSVMIPVFNRVEYLPETLRSVLVQDPGAEQMQIEVVDDCSTLADPEALVRQLGGGRITYHRQLRNVGLVENFNACIRRARGRWVHILHSDDAVRPGFYAKASAAIAAQAEIEAWFCRVIYIDSDSLWRGLSELDARTPQVMGEDFAERLMVTQHIQFAGMLVKRSTYEAVGGFRPELKLAMDWDMWKRIAVRGRMFHDPRPLALFRLHDESAWAEAARDGANIADRRRSIEIACSYVPPERAARIRREALKQTAVYCLREAERRWRHGHRAVALRLVREALRSSLAPEVLARMLFVLSRRLAPGTGDPLSPQALR